MSPHPQTLESNPRGLQSMAYRWPLAIYFLGVGRLGVFMFNGSGVQAVADYSLISGYDSLSIGGMVMGSPVQ